MSIAGVAVHGVLGFSDRKQDGRLAVMNADGRPEAFITTRWTGGSFAATLPDGTPLCSGKARRGGFSRHWDVLDADGRPLLDLRTSAGRTHRITLADGRELTIRGQWFGRDWSLSDAEHVVLSSVPTRGPWSFHPDDWLVEQDGTLTLAHVVGIVEIYRLSVKSSRHAASSSGTG